MAKVKVKRVVHKLSTLRTACGMSTGHNRIVTKPTWRGVTCKRCLMVRDTAAKAKKKKRN